MIFWGNCNDNKFEIFKEPKKGIEFELCATSLRKEEADRSSEMGAAMAMNLLFFITCSLVARPLRVVYDGGCGDDDDGDVIDRFLPPATLSVETILALAALASSRTEKVGRSGNLTAIWGLL